MANKDYYQILGLSKNSTPEEIKKAYRKLALEYHPDRNKTKEADAKFKEVTKAYEILSDPQKKQAYDQFGAAAFEQGTDQYGPFSYTYTTNSDQNFDFGGFSDPFEIFEQFFGGGGSPFTRRERRPVYSITISFMEAVHGVAKKVSIEGKNQTIKIPKGVDNGSRIRFDKYDVMVRVQADTRFQREGYDIVTEKEVSFPEAALGTEAGVDTIDGIVRIKVPAGTQPGTVIRLRDRGVFHVRGSQRGDHYVRIKIAVPKNLSSRQKELLKEFDESGSKKSWYNI